MRYLLRSERRCIKSIYIISDAGGRAEGFVRILARLTKIRGNISSGAIYCYEIDIDV